MIANVGGGNGILGMIGKVKISFAKLHNVFVSHGHTDHVLGIVWIIRKIGTLMLQCKHDGNLYVYCHDQLDHIVCNIVNLTLEKKITQLIRKRLIMAPIVNGQQKRFMGHDFTLFDIHSTKVNTSLDP